MWRKLWQPVFRVIPSLLPDTDNFIDTRRLQILLLIDVWWQVSLRAARCESSRNSEQNHLIKNLSKDRLQPRQVQLLTFLLAVNSLILILLAGESSNNSIDGILSPSWKTAKKSTVAYQTTSRYQNVDGCLSLNLIPNYSLRLRLICSALQCKLCNIN